METCSTVTAQVPPALSRVLIVEQLTISQSRPQTGHATAPSVTQCRVEQVTSQRLSSFKMFPLKWNNTLNPPLSRSPLAPCPPDAVEVQLLPMQMEVQVMGFSWAQVTCNNTDYMLKLTGSLLGDSQAQFELSSYWTSKTYFEIPLPCGSAYVAAVESRNAAGTSNPSAPLSGTTGRLRLTLQLLFKHIFYIYIRLMLADSSNGIRINVFITA